MQKLKYYTNPSDDTISIGLDLSLTSTGVTVKVGSRFYTIVVSDKAQSVSPMFNSIIYKRLKDKERHSTLNKYLSLNNKWEDIFVFINSVFIEEKLTWDDVEKINIESLALTSLGASSRLSDTTMCMTVALTKLQGVSKKIRLVSPISLKVFYLGTKKEQDAKYGRTNKGAVWKPKDKVLIRFKEEFGHIEGKKNDDAIDSYVLTLY